MRSISEKKRSAAAIKSLLDLMAENRSLQSVYTMDGLYATSNQYESPPEISEKVVQNDQGKVHILNSGISYLFIPNPVFRVGYVYFFLTLQCRNFLK